ncbi:MAG: M48 family metalloprotease [Lautropia sp.]
MDFDRHRYEAARAARRLWLLYAIAVLGVVAVFDGAGWLIWRALFAEAPLPIGFHTINVLATAGLVVGGSLVELSRFDRHPDTVAQRLGARAVEPGGRGLTLAERRLVNVVEEMALAAHVPVPRIFVVEREPSINALATGLTVPASAIIVTAGALERLSRNELQGVIAHEIAHIASGDVAVGTRVAALNAGLELVSDAGRRFGAIGTILLVCGSAGHLAATLIAAAMSRNREFHADALAVVLTREPTGLARALRKLWWIADAAALAARTRVPRPWGERRARSPLEQPCVAGFRAAMFDASAMPATWLRTHPPLRERIARLLGYAAGPLPCAEADAAGPGTGVADASDAMRTGGIAGLAGNAGNAGNAADSAAGAALAEAQTSAAWLARHALPALAFDRAVLRDAADPGDPMIALVQATHDANDAAALAMLLVCGAGADESTWPPRWRVASSRQQHIADQLRRLPSASIQALRWPLLERCAASLRGLAEPWPRELLGALRARIELDQRVTLSEWIYYMLLRVRLAGDSSTRCRGDEAEIDAAQAVRWTVMLLARATAQPELRAQRVANELVRALALPRTSPTTPPLDVGGLQSAVASLRGIGLLQRPLLMRGLVDFLVQDAPVEARDFLRVLALVIDTPLPRFGPPRPDGAIFTRAQAIPAA